MEFTIITNRQLSARIRGRIATAEKRAEAYWNDLFNCVNRCYDHNDVSWVNMGLTMARAEGKFRATKAILQQVTPFKFDTKTQMFGGKRSKNMYDKLNENLKYGAVLNQLIADQKEADSKPVKAKDWEYEKARDNFLKACVKHDVELKDVVVDIREYAKQKAA